MKKFYDKEVGLTFKCYSEKESRYGYLDDDYVSYISQMNLWEDEGIKNFVVSSAALGFFFNVNNSYCTKDKNNNSQLVMGFDDDQLIGCAQITTNNPPISNSLIDGKSSLYMARSDKNPLINIEYIATDPLLRGQGYGARLIKGIMNNEKILTNDINSSGITAFVRHNNLPSQKAFLKNKFIIVHKSNLLRPAKLYHMLYSGKHAVSLEKE